MELLNYPDYSNHKQQHDAFIAKIKGFSDRFSLQGDNSVLLHELITEFTHWLDNHIKAIDTKLATFFQANAA
jgi:hemerythrin